MEYWQALVVGGYGLLSLAAGWSGYRKAIKRGDVFGLTPQWTPLGVFVNGDGVVIGSAGAIASLILLLINNWWLSLSAWSLFWAVRAMGEIIYWLNQQYSQLERNPPRNLLGYKWFPNDSLWFVYQLCWQLILVTTGLLTMWFAKNWLMGN